MDQYRLAARVEELWNEWEIQVLVLVSFSLQVFLLLFSGTRKRTTSKFLRILLWLAYLSADTVAIFVLGHLTLHINGGLRHGLVLFWAPFMLLHLGGQETMTAFSMEDNTLWKRHLLDLGVQVGLAAYVVGKQWQGDNEHLLAPMVLMFISGTIKYAGRISALMFVAQLTSRGDIVLMINNRPRSYQHITDYKHLVLEANRRMFPSMVFLLDIESGVAYRHIIYEYLTRNLLSIVEMERRVQVCYKLTELQLSMVYDNLYTKLGVHFEREEWLNGWVLQLVTFGSTFTALFLFAWADIRGNLFNYNRADIIVSYILLGGGVILEALSICIVISSFRAMEAVAYGGKFHDMIISIVSRAHPESRSQWSQKLAQYSLITGCMQDKKLKAVGGGLLERMMRATGIKPSSTNTTSHADVSYELKKLLLDKLLQVADRRNTDDEWDSSKLTGQWARLELQSKMQLETSSIAHLQELLGDSLQRAVSLMFSVLTWHVATEICFFSDEDEIGCDRSSSRGPSRLLSNYVMHLFATYSMHSGGHAGRIMLQSAQRFITNDCLSHRQLKGLDQSAVARLIVDELQLKRPAVSPFLEEKLVDGKAALLLAFQLSEELLKIEEANDRWDIIMLVWMEMVCYMALHFSVGFHTEHLSQGGEFITHVKILVHNLCLLPLTNQDSTVAGH
ncbi:uncharacterized protein LOC121055160 [Oryza brachyantha]|uniref:uncharacterized protein LOC121055160 n=1 Tax=Oryza brachyantha TaxID=4533 RepID=UPI001ADA936E|nr:uncharacterized protein LOC121055160 [Oryza brachyantha]